MVIDSVYDEVRVYGTASSFHPGAANFCFADGHVRSVNEKIDCWELSDGEMDAMWNTGDVATVRGVYQALSTRNGGEQVGDY
jgi:prepilin-type processing-associated H-X9-DG protein